MSGRVMRDFPMSRNINKEMSDDVKSKLSVAGDRTRGLQHHCSAMFVKFQELREEGRLLDCMVSVQTVQIPAHKLVLAAFSSYIDALLKFDDQRKSKSRANNEKLREDSNQLQSHDVENREEHNKGSALKSQEKSFVIKLDGMNPDSVELLINYAYTGCIDVNVDNVHDLLICADFLCITSIVAECREFIVESVSMENCFQELQFAMSINDRELVNHTRRFLAQRFTDVVKSDEFLNLDQDLVMEILQDNDLVVMERVVEDANELRFFVEPSRQEELIFKSIVSFVVHDTETRGDLLSVLLTKGLRVGFLPDDITETFGVDNEIAATPAYTEVHHNALTLIREMKSDFLQSGEKCCDHWTIPRSLSVLTIKPSQKMAANRQLNVMVDMFDDSSLCPVGSVQYVTAMTLYSRRWDGRHVVGGIEVTYSNGQTVLHGSNDYRYPDTSENAGERYEVDQFTLDPDERIVSATARLGAVIDALSFVTSKKVTHGPYGGPGGGFKRITAPAKSAYLAFLKGGVEEAEGTLIVRHLELAWAYNALDS